MDGGCADRVAAVNRIMTSRIASASTSWGKRVRITAAALDVARRTARQLSAPSDSAASISMILLTTSAPYPVPTRPRQLAVYVHVSGRAVAIRTATDALASWEKRRTSAGQRRSTAASRRASLQQLAS